MALHGRCWRSNFIKFLGTVKPILVGPGFKPSRSDDEILRPLVQLVLNIDEGIEMVDAYALRMGLLCDPLAKAPSTRMNSRATSHARSCSASIETISTILKHLFVLEVVPHGHT